MRVNDGRRNPSRDDDVRRRTGRGRESSRTCFDEQHAPYRAARHPVSNTFRSGRSRCSSISLAVNPARVITARVSSSIGSNPTVVKHPTHSWHTSPLTFRRRLTRTISPVSASRTNRGSGPGGLDARGDDGGDRASASSSSSSPPRVRWDDADDDVSSSSSSSSRESAAARRRAPRSRRSSTSTSLSSKRDDVASTSDATRIVGLAGATYDSSFLIDRRVFPLNDIHCSSRVFSPPPISPRRRARRCGATTRCVRLPTPPRECARRARKVARVVPVICSLKCVLYKSFSPIARFQDLIASPFN
eukprot:30342-Pelagococcus_subviridis.AAC.4